ncbi:hypothetical protein [Streptomyces iconiensis]|uniref:Uncharacterized protein n=1 Tax=Streptomyces iconiensis TaxID=1384038 RepID=A0ABT7AAX8_9ACTN|nr:hypothetical protein [Streptomyces iconiensis]MDJ1138503.1 hypothetical protein [Streptomyces iconiensis]
MSAPNSPRLKSIPTPDQPGTAEPTSPTTGRSAPKNAARRAPSSALRPDPHTGDGRYPLAWLHITAPHGATPTAKSVCACGRDRFAAGRHKVLALIEDHTAHRENCPLRTASKTERRNAA